jgi:hypothetical protein
MTPFCLQHEFEATPERFWKVFLDPAYNEALYARIEVREHTVLAWRDDGGTVYRSIRIMPKRDLPRVVQALTGAHLGYTENTLLHKAENRIDVTVIPTALTDRTSIQGTYSLVPLDKGRLRRTFEGTIHIDVPLVGRRIEKIVLDDMARSYDKAAEVTAEWLRGWRA